MDRIVEPELMEGDAQADAYADADFEDANQAFVDRFARTFPGFTEGRLVDLGCGPADIPIRIARTHPKISIVAIDGSAAMLARGRRVLGELAERIELVEATLPGAVDGSFDAVISNSLLHHLHDPSVLWREIAKLAKPNAPILVVDLFRPNSVDEVERLVATYTDGEPDVLRTDFYNSLRAAFTGEEIREQLVSAGLAQLDVQTISDRHLAITGRR